MKLYKANFQLKQTLWPLTHPISGVVITTSLPCVYCSVTVGFSSITGRTTLGYYHSPLSFPPCWCTEFPHPFRPSQTGAKIICTGEMTYFLACFYVIFPLATKNLTAEKPCKAKWVLTQSDSRQGANSFIKFWPVFLLINWSKTEELGDEKWY